MGNKARRRAWAALVRSDPRLNETDKRVALAVAEADRRGFRFLAHEDRDEFWFEPNEFYAAAKLAA